MEHNEAVMYRGPFQAVEDDNGHRFRRGQRTAVCRKTFQIMTRPPYQDHFIAVEPMQAIAADEAAPFTCTGGEQLRSPSVTKGPGYKATSMAVDCCEPGECCGPDDCC
jgi:hypothetical protein